MKTIYLVCLVVAGAALARAWGCPGKISPTCIPIFKPVKPGPGPTPVNCPLCEVRAIAEKLTNPSVHVPICAGDVFRKYQYDKATKERFCVTRDGEEIPKSRKKGIGNPAKYCDAFPIKDKTTPAKRPCDVRKKAAGAAGAFISCQKNGYYAPVQKRQNWRWCVTRDGQPVPMTMSHPVKKNWGKANCARFRNFRYQCKKDGFFLLPWDCTRYITCSGGNGHICSCPFGQGFDPKLKVCNWVENVKGCKLSKG